jgi:hypothetical protein
MQISPDKLNRQKVFSEPTTRELLRRLVVEKKTLIPEVGQDGSIHYMIADEVLGSASVAREWIKQMMDFGILRESAKKDMVMCPIHYRIDPAIELECPKCRARSMRKTSLVEHVYCGYIEADTKFEKNGALVCPNCKRPVRPGELKGTGVWFECQQCLTKTSAPKVVFVCRNGHEYTTADLALVPVYTYEVEATVVAALKNTLVLNPALAAMLTSMGFTVSSPANVQGTSGTRHSLDLYAKMGDTDIALQIEVDTGPVDALAVTAFFAKVYDIRPKYSVLITIPSASEAAKLINKGYGILLLEDADGAGAVQKVKGLLREAS